MDQCLPVERHVPPFVSLAGQFVAKGLSPPHRVHLGISVDAKLRDKFRDDPEKATLVVESQLHQVIEPVRPQRRPVAVRFDHEWPCARLEIDPERVRRPLGGRRRIHQRRPVSSALRVGGIHMGHVGDGPDHETTHEDTECTSSNDKGSHEDHVLLLRDDIY